MPIRSIHARTTAKATLPTRFAQLFLRGRIRLPDADLARCMRGCECCQAARHAPAGKDLCIKEVTISQALLQFRKYLSHDAPAATLARTTRHPPPLNRR